MNKTQGGTIKREYILLVIITMINNIKNKNKNPPEDISSLQ